MKTVVVVTEEDGNQAMYVDGVLRQDDYTIYAWNIAEAAGDEPIQFKHHDCEFDEDEWYWPEKIEDVPGLFWC